MRHTGLSQIISQIKNFPTLPAIAARVLLVVSDPESTAGDLTGVILPDPAMTMSILKIANSAFLGLPKKVATLQHAIAIMGFNEIQNLVLAKAICQSFKGIEKNSKFDLHKFWMHSFLCGLAAKIIAADEKGVNSVFFVAGLIHDIGKLVILTVFPEEFSQLATQSTALCDESLELEKSTFGLGHDDAGLRLARRWFLPSNLASAAGFHHNFQKADPPDIFSLTVHLADMLAHLVDAKEENGEKQFYRERLSDDYRRTAAATHGLTLTPEKIDRYEQELNAARQENIAILQMFIG